MRLLKKIYHFFPIQLLILHFKNHQILLFFWFMLFLTVSGNFGKNYGIPYLFLDPEYLGDVNFISFTILGAAFGGFLMTWNITTYILDSYRFPFLATFHRPFALFCLNNSLLPIAFFTTYFIIMVNFQLNREFELRENIIYDIAGFFSGLLIIVFIAALYFSTTNKNIFSLFGVQLQRSKRIRNRVRMRQSRMWEDFRKRDEEFKVNYYFTARFQIRRIRDVAHYEEKMVISVLRQNHSNALIIELATLATLVGLGFLIDYQVFNIPAGASALLMFGILVSLSGLLSFWLKGWKNTVIIILVLGIDMLFRNEVFDYENQAYGLNYETTPAIYSYENMKRMSSKENVERDRKNTIAILDNWKKKTGKEKPKMVLFNASGGGLSASMFTALVIQRADSMMNGELLKHTALITGSSGGIFGAAYIRELYLQKQTGILDSYYPKKYAYNIAKDLLNPICFTFVVNDILYPWQEFKVGDYSYKKDRGYIMEKILNENTDFAMDKTIGDYTVPEKDALVPMLVIVPTIINDGKKLYISSQPISYLMKPLNDKLNPDYIDIDGVDFGAMFEQQDARNLKLTSAIRMNATYPYILPHATMPSQPVIKVMDAGFRDNFGLETTTRFLHVFRDWIKANTSGVIIIQVRNSKKDQEIEGYQVESFFGRTMNPVGNLYSNWETVQDYNQNYFVSLSNEWVEGKVEIINFEYIPQKKEQKAAMSLHLTTKEKSDILMTMESPHIQGRLNRLQSLLEE